MDLGLANARVLVTGGGSNIGRAIVHAFAAEGSRIVIADIDGNQAEKVRAEALERGAAGAEVSVGDLTLEGVAEQAVDAVVSGWGGIDVLVNNAGWSKGTFLVEDTDRANWQRTVEVNFYAAVACTQAAIAPMRAAGTGSIVFISSDSAFGQIRQGIYGATKAALIALARTTAKEHGRHGIRSNIICPGLVIPDGPDAVGADSLWAAGADSVFNEKQIEFLKQDIPLRRLTDADDVANSVLWMASASAARQITGQMISVSGGYTMP
jgi:NAD(P)-dependent dehydrogenase (short-subunit alcohol dehydrogenase family)